MNASLTVVLDLYIHRKKELKIKIENCLCTIKFKTHFHTLVITLFIPNHDYYTFSHLSWKVANRILKTFLRLLKDVEFAFHNIVVLRGMSLTWENNSFYLFDVQIKFFTIFSKLFFWLCSIFEGIEKNKNIRTISLNR